MLLRGWMAGAALLPATMNEYYEDADTYQRTATEDDVVQSTGVWIPLPPILYSFIRAAGKDR